MPRLPPIPLADAAVLIVGAGGLGCPAARALAAAGLGRLGVVDSDRVDLSNLHRQILHRTRDVGRPKPDSAREALLSLHPRLIVEAWEERLTPERARALFRSYDFVLDGSDNFDTKYLVNRASVETGVPFTYAGILRFEGQLLTVVPGRTGCFRCLFRDPPPPGVVPDCQEAGVLGAVAGVLGGLQAAEALLWLQQGEAALAPRGPECARPALHADRVLVYEARTQRFRSVPFRRDPACPACGKPDADARDPATPVSDPSGRTEPD